VKTEPLPGSLVTVTSPHARELAREGKAQPRPTVATRGTLHGFEGGRDILGSLKLKAGEFEPDVEGSFGHHGVARRAMFFGEQ
jgi:hypothetical protein